MRHISSFSDAERALEAYIPSVNKMLGKDITLGRMRSLMKGLGNPQDKLRIIHVAGTSGKTSTAYYTASLLGQAGQNVGLTVSPHIDTVAERLQINLRPLEEKDFCQTLTEFLGLIKDLQPVPTYFELLVGMAYWYFAKSGVDYAVIETGLGGLHDATNIAGRPDKVCAITDIGYDHMHVLGETIAEIASQKAGIIHPSNTVLMHPQTKEINAVVQNHVKHSGATLKLITKTSLKNSDLPIFQQRNWTLSLGVYEQIRQRDNLSDLTAAHLRAAKTVKIPGRMDTRKVGSKTLIMDGAHNQQKMQAFVTSFQAKYPGKKATVLLGLKNGKDYRAVLQELFPITNELIVTNFAQAQDLPVSSMNPELLANEYQDMGGYNSRIISNPLEAYRALMKTPADLLVITGSFFLISQIRKVHKPL